MYFTRQREHIQLIVPQNKQKQKQTMLANEFVAVILL